MSDAKLQEIFKTLISTGRTDLEAELRIYIHELRDLAYCDELTGLLNRRALMADLEVEVSRAYRSKQPLSLLMIDIDHFKKVNDTLTHETGDQVLCNVAKTLRGTLWRKQDKLYRYGGEEKTVLLPDTPLQGGLLVAEKLRLAVSQTCYARKDWPITISVGIATTQFDELMDYNALIHNADIALYEAKKSGRNKVCAYEKIKDE